MWRGVLGLPGCWVCCGILVTRFCVGMGLGSAWSFWGVGFVAASWLSDCACVRKVTVMVPQ